MRDSSLSTVVHQRPRAWLHFGCELVDVPARNTALTVFDWRRNAAKTWGGSNTSAGCKILDSGYLNRVVYDAPLVATKRKPFDLLVAWPDLKKSRGDYRLFELFAGLVVAYMDAFLQSVEPRLRVIADLPCDTAWIQDTRSIRLFQQRAITLVINNCREGAKLCGSDRSVRSNGRTSH